MRGRDGGECGGKEGRERGEKQEEAEKKERRGKVEDGTGREEE